MKKIKEKIQKAYIKHILTHGTAPKSVFVFMDQLEEEEKTFYEHYQSFQQVEEEVWADLMEETLQKVKGEEVYPDYACREKMLSFYFTLLEVLKNHRSLVQYTFKKDKQRSRHKRTYPTLKAFRKKFTEYAQEVVSEGLDTGEIASRPYLDERYAKMMWWQLISIVNYWQCDKSAGFERTDAFVEKSVNFTFDGMGNTPLDSGIDLVRFLFQK